MKRIAILLAACAVSVCFCDDLRAQRRIPYASRRPAVSPWVSLYQSSNGGVNNYFGMIRPRQQMLQFTDQTMQFATTQRALDRQAGQQFTQLEQAIQLGLLQQRPTSTVTRVPARAASFMDYSRFYPQTMPGGRGVSAGRSFNR
jgi:hypothetical protein